VEQLDGPLTKTNSIFLPALGSETWALHLAGEYHRTAISYGCFDCAAGGEPVDDYVPLLVVGYGPQPNSGLLL
jgi:hypothetical protein